MRNTQAQDADDQPAEHVRFARHLRALEAVPASDEAAWWQPFSATRTRSWRTAP